MIQQLDTLKRDVKGRTQTEEGVGLDGDLESVNGGAGRDDGSLHCGTIHNICTKI